MIVEHGGRYIPYLDGTKTKATHIVASNLTPSKRIAFKEYKVVTSEWVTDSIRLRKVQDWRNYREDQVQARDSDMGKAPIGTQIAQPRLTFARPTQLQADSKPVIEKQEQTPIPEAAKEAEEYTANPDVELEANQIDQHTAYENQQFYQKTGFDE